MTKPAKAPEQFTFFWDGPFSQWYPSEFRSSGRVYSSAEQYMMARKARLFDDTETEALIMATKDPKEQKRLGRLVRGFDVAVWREHADAIVYMGNYAKFKQSQYLRTLLMETVGTTLVEASPFDTVWGIGLAADNPAALDRATWRGENLLGEVLTRLRDEMFPPPAEHTLVVVGWRGNATAYLDVPRDQAVARYLTAQGETEIGDTPVNEFPFTDEFSVYSADGPA